jgi:hypothetical protein
MRAIVAGATGAEGFSAADEEYGDTVIATRTTACPRL